MLQVWFLHIVQIVLAFLSDDLRHSLICFWQSLVRLEVVARGFQM